MENRRPPRPKPPGRNFDRSRSSAPPRGSNGGGDTSGQGRGRSGSSGDGRYEQRSGSGTGSGRGRGPTRNDGRRFGEKPTGRFGNDSGRNRQRPTQTAKGRSAPDEIRITSDAQVTDGKFRGRTLLNSDSPNTQHTIRKVRESAFRVLSRRVKAARILDLGAACGTIGIEALSRGAMLVTFVERSARMCSFIRKNLAELGIKSGHGEVIEMEVLPFIQRTARRRRCWDLVYLDLPDGDNHAAIVALLGRGICIKPAGLLVIQHASSISYPEKIGRLNRWRIIEQGETILSIYERI